MEDVAVKNLATLANPFFAEILFDRLDDIVFFVKDVAACYTVVNTTLVKRCGLLHKSELIGRSALDVFSPALGSRYLEQDRFVLEQGQEIVDRLEIHLYANHEPGWCLTNKIPLLNPAGQVIGLAGISRDLQLPDQKHPVYHRIAHAIDYIQTNYSEPLDVAELAGMAKSSVAQFERYIKRVFKLTPKQLIIKTRLEAATKLLEGSESVAEIAHACGYNDHSAFSRQFKAVVGLSPQTFREIKR